MLNWTAKSWDERGKLLLAPNPLKGLRSPTEKNPTRVVLSEEEYQALLGVSREVDWRCRVALVLAHETGNRIGAIRQLQWSDIDFESGTIVWRSEHDKSGYSQSGRHDLRFLPFDRIWSRHADTARVRRRVPQPTLRHSPQPGRACVQPRSRLRP